MYIIASFDYSTKVELAITELMNNGVEKTRIMAVPLNQKTERTGWFDYRLRADGTSLFDISALLGTVFMLLGVIYGFIWHWGPIIWGLIGLLVGLTMGFLFELWKGRWRQVKLKNNKSAEIILIIHCEKEIADKSEEILWYHSALGVARLDLQ